jgi:hypothetical protein
MLDEKRLSELYRHPMQLAGSGDETIVRAARPEPSGTRSRDKAL